MESIGIDIDSTTFDTDSEMINYIGLYYNEVFSKQSIKNSLEDLKGVEEHVIRDAVDLAVSNINSKMHKNAKETIQWLSEFYNIWFITYRDPKFTLETLKLLDRLEVPYNTVFTTREIGKHSFIRNHNISVYIEDDAETIKNISEDCICLIYDQPWNKNLVQTENIIRVYNWKEVKDYFIIRGVK